MAVPLRVLLADDHAIVRQGLKFLIDSQPDMGVVGETADGTGVVDQANALKPDIVVMDISMPGMNGLVATRTLKRVQPNLAIVALTRHDDDTHLEELLRAGASGYVLKQSAPLELLQAIRAVAAGGMYLDPAMTSRVADGLLARKAETPEPAPCGDQRSRIRRTAADSCRAQQQGDRDAAEDQCQDRRSPQGERHAEARTDRPRRHNPIRCPARLALRYLVVDCR